MFEYIDYLKDERVNCYSVIVKVEIAHYLNFIEDVYKSKGGIEGQRSPLKTRSAQRIRKRLVDDLIKGTVIPPIVIGVKLNNEQFKSLDNRIEQNIDEILNNVTDFDKSQISVIDGMQRTTALLEASQINESISKRYIRLELWLSEETNSLIYRMLVLNSGQIPWNIKRQLDVVFSQLKKELEENVEGLELFTSDDSERRRKAGQYQASQFIELFMLFSTKRVNIDIQEELAEEFARLDIIETSGNDYFTYIFLGVSKLLVDLDTFFSKLDTNPTDIKLRKFKTGKDIFSSQPARAGFITAISQEIFGIPGIEIPEDLQLTKYWQIKEGIDLFINKEYNQNTLFSIIDLPTLDEQINIKTSKIGEFERNFFLKSFKTFIDLVKSNESFSLTPCWRSYH